MTNLGKQADVVNATRTCPDCSTVHVDRIARCRLCQNALRRRKREAAAPQRTCSECSASLAFKSPITCSDVCAVARRRRLRGVAAGTSRDCASCGQSFVLRRSQARFCSEACYDRDKYVRYSQDPEMAERRRESTARWHEANRDRELERKRVWREQNRERHSAMSMAWYAANRHRITPWRTKYPERHAAKQRRRVRRERELTPYAFSHEQVLARIEYWGGNCWMCGVPADTVDHVKPMAAGGLNIPANLRPACRSCNSRKRSAWFGPHHLARFIRAASDH